VDLTDTDTDEEINIDEMTFFYQGLSKTTKCRFGVLSVNDKNVALVWPRL
jgi:hypothetical protein